MPRGEGTVPGHGAGGVIRDRGRMSWSGVKTNENERATEPTDDVASRGTEVYASSGPFYSGPPGATVFTSTRIFIFYQRIYRYPLNHPSILHRFFKCKLYLD